MARQTDKLFPDVAARADSSALEQGILRYWETEKIFERSLEQRQDGPLFTFYDGPPYATGKPHYGHVLQSAVKDTVLRYKTMQGYSVPRRVGWDCHGLPVEVLVEKELGLKSKQDIETMGIEAFNARCREAVFRYIDEFTAILKRLGRWADYDAAYATLDKNYMESEWWVFRQLWDQDLVYKAFRTTPYCIRCATPLSNFEVSSNYKETTDTAVYVLLPVAGREKTFFLVWTTTPWTLPANVAIAIHPTLPYVSVTYEEKEIIVAQARVLALFGQSAAVTRQWSNEQLQALQYQPLYPQPETHGPLPVVFSEHVTADDGTGLVHIAPAFGEEDASLGVKHSLPTVRTVDGNGYFLPSVPQWGGTQIFASNADIVADLEARELLWRREEYRHSYPFCWRCDTPLIYYALDTWFIRVQALKERMLAINEQIDWTPQHVKHGRFAKGIESAPDWAVSRNRYWSVPVPIWECSHCEDRVCVGSVAELQTLSGAGTIDDLHRPYVDAVRWTCRTCGQGEMRRVAEVLDVWFDSGAMPYAQWHYPFEHKEFVERGFPADFIAESIEMTRAWFYVLHVLATALTKADIGLGVDQPAYRHVIASGLIFAEDGQKLSKKLKNYPALEPTLERYGADALRFYLLASTALGEPYRFSEREMTQLKRQTYDTLWNVYSFFTRYANVHAWQPRPKAPESDHVLDRWILARLRQVERTVIQHADRYQIDHAARDFVLYIDDLSNWYVRRSRSRFQPANRGVGDAGVNQALDTLFTVLERTVRLLAPFMPFVSEEIFRALTGRPSVHLESLPATDALPQLSESDTALLDLMVQARQIVSVGLALRAHSGIKVRQPLAAIVVDREPLPDMVHTIVQEELNVKEIRYGALPAGDQFAIALPDEPMKVALDTTMTEALRIEGWAREIIRYGQVLRKRAGLALHDRIRLILNGEQRVVESVLAAHAADIRRSLQADEIISSGQEELGQDVTISGMAVHLGIAKI